MKKSVLVLAAIFGLLSAIIFSGCYEPSPLYGKWADNDGNSINFISDGTFNAKIYNAQNTQVVYQGEYTVIDNVLVFNYKSASEESSDSYSMNTEWDIRGSMLYLTWSANNYTKVLTLYHTSK